MSKTSDDSLLATGRQRAYTDRIVSPHRIVEVYGDFLLPEKHVLFERFNKICSSCNNPKDEDEDEKMKRKR